MNNLNNFKFKCCGCSTCEQICPKNAISMIENDEGFKEFFIDKDKCINCGLCAKKCPQLNKFMHIEKQQIIPEYYAAYMKDQNKIIKSASGGIFQAIANNISKMGNFAIFGCKYDENFKATHGYIENISKIECFLSSKYVQSDTSKIYICVKEKLEQDKVVLFSGTPCQISGLYSFLYPKTYDKLYTIDIVCHGVPSPLLFKKYINYIENKNKGKIEEYNFRSKIKNTWDTLLYYRINSKKHIDNYYFDAYYYNFIKGNNYRECCYECLYANKNRVSDITIGDYWGIEKVHPNMTNKLGVSLMIVNTKKGKQLFDLTKNDIVYCNSSFENMSKYNHNLISPTVRTKKRDEIYKGLNEKSYKELLKTNLKYKIPIRILISLKTPKIIKKIYKKIKA